MILTNGIPINDYQAMLYYGTAIIIGLLTLIAIILIINLFIKRK